MGYELRAASSQDRSWLERLRRDAYRDLFDTTFGGWDERRHERQFEDCLRAGGISVIIVDGEAVGMLQQHADHAEVRIGEIQIQPSHQSRGLGTEILADLIAAAHQERKTVRLSVGLMNERAYRLYLRLGFQEAGRSSSHAHLVCEPAA